MRALYSLTNLSDKLHLHFKSALAVFTEASYAWKKKVTCKSAGPSLAGLCRNGCCQYRPWPPRACCPALIRLYSILWLRSCYSFPDGDREIIILHKCVNPKYNKLCEHEKKEKHLMDACDAGEQRDLGGEAIQALLEHVQSGDGLIKPLIHLRSTNSSYWDVITAHSEAWPVCGTFAR